MKQSTMRHLAISLLAFMWVWTGLSSLFFAPEIGYQVLANANIKGQLADFCVYFGAITDMVIGLWLIIAKDKRLCLFCQVFIIVIYTLLLTLIDSSFWLHPFGPLSKNLPILALIGLLYYAPEKVA